ncbi:nuclear transport factor 2 [Rhizopus microsporus var. microsporus]|uniref:Nuclear transport factor 2 n=2 Tax=Rhizopus microsporus TaxID=58291 RepID=A0A2G4T872_RHIZD|nr:nuclear transport factor 2 [Rhizopus microsporus ATCC 52813]ORE09203.1 nuclear transport factor 2 [Rhizopus microsporus var. microsporus]PHZ17218.1 nuclear transport factor 2 [Rhizopus microsporus ATCC 52813]
MADINTLATQFVNFYYDTFDSNRSNLQGLYRDNSMLTFEGTPVQGAAAITEKLTTLPFQRVQHKVTTIDVQPSGPNNSLIVTVSGMLVVDDSPNPLMFFQTFQLISENNAYYVLNDIFRLNYG